MCYVRIGQVRTEQDWIGQDRIVARRTGTRTRRGCYVTKEILGCVMSGQVRAGQGRAEQDWIVRILLGSTGYVRLVRIG